MLTRRETLALMLGGALARAAEPRAIRFAYSGFVWQKNVEEGIRTVARYGFHGIEPFRNHVLTYLDKPQALKSQLDEAGISLVTCSNGGPMSTNFIDPAEVGQTIEDHFRFGRDFIRHFNCRHFKINLGRRPENGPTDEQLKTMAGALNELGKRLAGIGLLLAPHPHIWSPLEREEEVRRVLELTDPSLVYIVADTAHLTLGGMDPVAIVRDYYPRVTALHFKDTEAKYRGFRGATPTQQEHRRTNLYKILGSGGVDFPAIMKLLTDRGFEGWITLDFDPPRPDEGTVDDQMTANKQYLEEILSIDL